jgi:predicted phage terminase large subunit-like protein
MHIEAGRVLLPAEAPWLAEFQTELLRFPQSQHDDQVDSLSQFLAWATSHSWGGPRIRTL